jgi:hypothetical protein
MLGSKTGHKKRQNHASLAEQDNTILIQQYHYKPKKETKNQVEGTEASLLQELVQALHSKRILQCLLSSFKKI